MTVKQVFSPFLPLSEYIPDGEPHVFEGRVYLFGGSGKGRFILSSDSGYLGKAVIGPSDFWAESRAMITETGKSIQAAGCFYSPHLIMTIPKIIPIL
jgi:arabinoxylan arabinofuranohydrolase